jgi:hypothetical protein
MIRKISVGRATARIPIRAVARVAVVGVILITACAGSPGPVTVASAPEPVGDERAACLKLTAALPSSLGTDLAHREIRPASPFVAAWGSPPTVLACGVPGVAPGYRPDVTLAVVDDVGWFAEDRGDRIHYSTPTRRPQVVVTLPVSVQAFDVLATLAGPILGSTRPTVP